jgi:hypothetical protein
VRACASAASTRRRRPCPGIFRELQLVKRTTDGAYRVAGAATAISNGETETILADAVRTLLRHQEVVGGT